MASSNGKNIIIKVLACALYGILTTCVISLFYLNFATAKERRSEDKAINKEIVVVKEKIMFQLADIGNQLATIQANLENLTKEKEHE